MDSAEAGGPRRRERELSVEVSPGLSPCRVSLGFTPGLQGLVSGRRPHIIESAALTLLGSDTDFEVDWDGVALSFRTHGECHQALGRALALWKRAAEVRAPAAVAPPAVAPGSTAGLRASRALTQAVAAALGATETAAPDQTVVELLVDALADADAHLQIEGPLSERDRRRLDLRRRPAPPTATLTPGTTVLAPGPDGMSHFSVMWQVGDEGPLLAALIGHPGYRIAERLAADMGLVHTFEAHHLAGPSLLVLTASLPGTGTGAALERLFIELDTLATSLKRPEAEDTAAWAGASILARSQVSLRSLASAVELLTRERAAIVVEPGRDDLESQVTHIDADLIASWISATLDLRCPAPDETRDRNTLLTEAHGFDARRYLVVSRALGRDTERMRQLDRELTDRCEEDKKLRQLLAPQKLLALHREIVCGHPPERMVGPDDPAELARRKAVFKKYRIDSSMYRPLLQMARRSPSLSQDLAAIAARCPEAR